MRVLCVVPCGKRKIWDSHPEAGPTRAAEVYTGPFASACRRYAEAFYAGSWVILSAKHGFLWPDDIVPEAYEVTFSNRRTRPITEYELKEQAHLKGLDGFGLVVAVAGRAYIDRLVAALPGARIETPLAGARGMGDMLAVLSRAVREGKPLQSVSSAQSIGEQP